MNNMGYGAITNRDAGVLEYALGVISGWVPAIDRCIDFLEIGTHRGGTARGVKEWCERNGLKLRYTGIESGAIIQPVSPFDGATMVFGDSIKVSHMIPGPFDLILVDGDHGGNHVVLETLLYGAKVRPGGIMLFHDTAPHIQQTMPEAEGPTEDPWFRNSVLAAHKLMGFPTPEWRLIGEDYDPDAKMGGMQAYRKVT